MAWSSERIRKQIRANARRSFETIGLLYPDAPIRSLWERCGTYYILCDDTIEEYCKKSATTVSKIQLSCCVIGEHPPNFVTALPAGSRLIPSRTRDEMLNLVGERLREPDIISELGFRARRKIPRFSIRIDQFPEIEFITTCEISEKDKTYIRSVVNEINPILHISKFSVEPVVSNRFPGILVPSTLLPTSYSQKTRELLEEDEDQWSENRSYAYNGGATRNMLPVQFTEKRSRCFIDATFSPCDVRMYLPLYRKLVISPPLAPAMSRGLAAIGVNIKDLCYLIRQGQVQLVFPHSLHLYSHKLVNTVAEESPEELLLPRSFALALLSDKRRRSPFLVPGLSVDERREYISALSLVASLDTPASRIIREILQPLGRSWLVQERAVQTMGGSGLSHSGLASIISAMLRNIDGHERLLEISSAASIVDYAGALDAHAAISPGINFDLGPSCELYASILSGFPKGHPIPDLVTPLDTILEGVLGISANISVRDIATRFQGMDVDRLREAIGNLAALSESPEELTELIANYNCMVRKFDRTQKQLRSFRIAGKIAAIGAVAVTQGGEINSGWLSLIALFIDDILAGVDLPRGLGLVLDTFRAQVSGFSPDVVLVNRLRYPTPYNPRG